MGTIGLLVPESTSTKEGFHALRRTTEGLLYYTKIDKDETDIIDFDGGSPTDKSGNTQLPSKVDYTEEVVTLRSGTTQYFTGDGSTVAFTLTTSSLDGTRLSVFVNNIRQNIDEVWSYASGVVTFKIAPFSNAQVAIGHNDKKLKNNTSDFYHQYVFENGDATYFIDDDGYLIKRENRAKGMTALASDNFSTIESSYPVVTATWQSAS